MSYHLPYFHATEFESSNLHGEYNALVPFRATPLSPQPHPKSLLVTWPAEELVEAFVAIKGLAAALGFLGAAPVLSKAAREWGTSTHHQSLCGVMTFLRSLIPPVAHVFILN